MSLLDHAQFPHRRDTFLRYVSVNGGQIIFVEDTKAIHILSSTALAVWQHADGRRSLIQIAEASGVALSLVPVALRSLAVADLMLSSDIVAAVFTDAVDTELSEPMVQSYAHGLAWIAGYNHAMRRAHEVSEPLPQGPSMRSANVR